MTCRELLEPVRAADITDLLDRLPTASHGVDYGCSVWMFERDSPLQRLLHAFKYGNRPELGLDLGEQLGNRFFEVWSSANHAAPHLLLPVPLHRRRYLSRGYNQAEQLALGMHRVLQIPVRSDLLRRVEATRTQTNLSRTERWDNVCTAFKVGSRGAIENQNIVLVDDVLTTGSTIGAAARALRMAGAASVAAATLAVARRYGKKH